MRILVNIISFFIIVFSVYIYGFVFSRALVVVTFRSPLVAA